MKTNAFYSILKAFKIYLNFCLEFLLMQKKLLDQKDWVNFKIFDVTTWSTNYYNTHIARCPTKKKNPDNEI